MINLLTSDKIIFFLIYLFIPSVVFSNAIANLILVLLTFITIFLIANQKAQIPKYTYFFFLFIFFLIIHPKTFFNFNLEHLIKIIFLIRFPLFLVLFIYLFNKKENKQYFRHLIYILIFLTSLLSIDIIFQFFFKIDILGYPPGQWDDELNTYKRYSGLFGDELIGGSYIFFNAIIILILIDCEVMKKKFNKYLIFLIFILPLVVILSGERVPLFKMFVVYAFYFFYKFKIDLKKISLALLALLVIMTLVNSNNILKKRLIDSTYSEIGTFENIKNNSYHFLHYTTAIKIFYDNKYFGAGYNSFRKVCKDYDINLNDNDERKAISGCSTHPHNMLIQILSSAGLVGLIIFLIFLKELIQFLLKKNNFILSVFVLTYFLPIIPSGSLYSSWTNFNFWFILSLGIIIKSNYSKIIDKQTS